MLHSTKKLDGMKIMAMDGKTGSVKDVYFDDEKWVLRYLQVDTGGWLTGRKVLVSPHSVTGIDWENELIHINLTKQQIQDGPGLDSHKPVSREHEEDVYRHFGYPYYWTGPYLWGYTVLPSLVAENPLEDPQRQEVRKQLDDNGNDNDRHLRSCDEVVGYDIHATDDTLGHVDDFLFDEQDWSIRLMVVDTGNWWSGKHVMIPPQRVSRVSWEEKEVFVEVTRSDIESSPEYDEASPPSGTQQNMFRDSGRPSQRP